MTARNQKQFQVGDRVSYPGMGLAMVISIEEKEIAGNMDFFYVLKLLSSRRKVLVPMNNAEMIGLRAILSEPEIYVVSEILKIPPPPRGTQKWNREYRKLVYKIQVGTYYDLAEALRDLYHLKMSKELSFGERRMFDLARNQMVEELALSLGQSEQEVSLWIMGILAAARAAGT